MLTAEPISFGNGGPSFALFIIIIAVVVMLRLRRGLHGTRFSITRLYRAPIIYSILSLTALLYFNLSYIELTFVPAAVLGVIAGYVLGGDVKFFERETGSYYKRSFIIMGLWLASYITRVITEYALPYSYYAELGTTIALFCTTGLMIGEAFRINHEYVSYAKKRKVKA